ncbi:Y-family DNA polymerase [Synechococcus sp. RSCCF101]|uniref:Y-family DNA polymerase n=1 Tax=Synechococcus sp. RSCCF101 TaxID=2511069 RepID=UPI001247C83A|nr:Y-family DNA polymerase [Synechococcus sp. RSCCF101]QEY31511.1 Y-family DNA polymerase [Synechococcus sp. RSCCF101]
MPQAIALIDGNNFYAACEKSLEPALIGRPLVVLSNNDGCIVARSAEARALGIAMGTPYFKARPELERHGVVVRSSNYALYGDMSQRLMSLLELHCDELEIYSIDEAFARITRPADGDLRGWASGLRALVRRDLGLPIAIGIGASKAQAKLANRLAKSSPAHAGMFDLGRCDDPDLWLERIAIEDVWGIGRRLSRWCRLRGIRTARQLRDMPSGELRARCGVVGLRLQRELHGHACLPMDLAPSPKRETCVSRSFSRPITRAAELREAVATYVSRAAEKLRRQRQRAGALTVFARTSPFAPGFYSNAASARLDLPSNDTAVLLAAALPLADRLFRPHRRLAKAGVLMQQLQGSDQLQQHLFASLPPAEQQRRERLMATIDRLNHRYGRGTVAWAACGLQPGWAMRRQCLSRAATTRLADVPLVRA